ncbi:MAG: class I SAM-dependent methyltransferase, partial [Bacteroidales bacterium]|nr:class I SAM-dependent methyltransferase [Bacteroidales bacterium]
MDQALFEYAEKYTSPESEVLRKLNRETHLTQIYPQMLAGSLQGTLLQLISQMIRPQRILEIGTFTGYSAICLATGLADPASGILHTIEANPELEPIIRKYLNEASLADSVVLHIGDAMDVIPTLNEV